MMFAYALYALKTCRLYWIRFWVLKIQLDKGGYGFTAKERASQ